MEYNELLIAILSGSIQGITELLPVSSSGHVILLSFFLSIDFRITEIATMHLGTLGSIILTFRDKIKYVLNKKSLINIVITSIPAGIIGFFFEDFIDEKLGSPYVIAATLIFWGIILIIVDQKSLTMKFKTTKLGKIDTTQAAKIGIGQILALVPGTSRSGVTTISGILSGLSPQTALEYSFLSGIPLIAASGLYGTLKMITDPNPNKTNLLVVTIATVSSFFFGIVAALILRRYIKHRILTACGIYRIAIGLILFAVIFTQLEFWPM